MTKTRIVLTIRVVTAVTVTLDFDQVRAFKTLPKTDPKLTKTQPGNNSNFAKIFKLEANVST